jgi:hypothetical protein
MDDKGQGGYYQEIARAFLARRGGPFFLSPKDQAAIAAWEAKMIPLDVVLEGVGRTFEDLKSRGRAAKTVSLAFCERNVEAAFAQHRDRAAGRRQGRETGPPAGKKEDQARREIRRALETLPAGDTGMRSLLETALEALAAARPDAEALERIEAEIEEALWEGATAAERTEAAAETRRALKGQKSAGFEDAVRRRVVLTARARRRVPHTALHYY